MPSTAVQLVQLLRSTKREKRLGTVILFVTSRCNSFCRTCFYHAELNRPGDMTFEQIEKVSRTMPPITDLWLSGGEPTLRHDASEIIRLFVRNNGVRRLIIPTNGLVKSRVYEIVEQALGAHSGLDLYLNIALDGYGETHDRIRGVPGHWEKTLDCITTLYPLKEKYRDRLRLNANTVVCADNYTEIEKLAEFMWSNFRLDGQYFNIVRGETLVGDEIKQVPADSLPRMYAFVSQLTKRYGDRMFADDDALKRFAKNVAYVGTITIPWERSAEVVTFGALLAFMAVNLSAMRHFWFSAEAVGRRNFFVDAVVPGFGFVFCAALLISLQPWTKYAGLVWLVVGIVYAAFKTRGFRLRPKLFDFSES